MNQFIKYKLILYFKGETCKIIHIILRINIFNTPNLIKRELYIETFI